MFKKFIVATTAVAVAATPLLVGMPAASAALTERVVVAGLLLWVATVTVTLRKVSDV